MSIFPSISVIITALNAEAYLAKAIESILRQTCDNFELFIVDDGSSDSTRQIISELAEKDSRIISLFNETNLGQPLSRNKAIDQSRAEYIAIMDADDIAMPNRLEVQSQYLQKHPAVGIVGSLAIEIDEQGQPRHQLRGHIKNSVECFWYEMTRVASSMVHPTVVLRRSILEKHHLRYNPETPYAQDKELWSRLLLRTHGVVLPVCLLKYRVHGASVSGTKTSKQRGYALQTVRQMVHAVLQNDSISETTIEQLVSLGPGFTMEALPAWELKAKLIDAMESGNRFDKTSCNRIRAMEYLNFRRWATNDILAKAHSNDLMDRLRSNLSIAQIISATVTAIRRKFQHKRLLAKS